jgi:hypothetical protein
VSFTKSISSWTVGLAIIAVFASSCATPVGVTRLDEQAARRELNTNVLSALAKRRSLQKLRGVGARFARVQAQQDAFAPVGIQLAEESIERTEPEPRRSAQDSNSQTT